MPQLASYIWADGPISMPSHPYKPDIREWATWVESFVKATGSNAGLVFTTQALLAPRLEYEDNTMAWVINDPTPALNGIYIKAGGGAGLGYWQKIGEVPYSFVQASNAGAGTMPLWRLPTCLYQDRPLSSCP